MRVNYITDEVKAVIGAHNGPILAYHPVEASEVPTASSRPSWIRPRAAGTRHGPKPAATAAWLPRRHSRRSPSAVRRTTPTRWRYGAARLRRLGAQLPRGLPQVQVPLPRLLNGGYEYEFFRYARVGERIYRSSTYLDIYQRDGRSGPMVFVIVADMFSTDHDVPLITATTTTILR